MSDLICANTMRRCPTPNMCATYCGCCHTVQTMPVNAPVLIAPDEKDIEIERLRAEVSTLNSALATTSEGNARLMAENSTLREALKNHAEEAAKMVKDAQRYQWLRAGTILCWRTELSGKAAFPAATKSTLDHEVDAMIAAAPKPDGR